MSLALGLPVTLVLAVGGPSCSSKPPAVGLASGCSLNSDCNSPLICVFSLCHDACNQSRDCPSGQRCVSVGSDNVCELPDETSCSASSPCPVGLTCESDLQCHNACTAEQPCLIAGQLCGANGCYDPVVPDGGAGDGPVTAEGATPDATSASDAPTEAPFMPNPDAGVLGFTPSNFNPSTVPVEDAGADWSNAPVASIMASCTNCLPATASTIAMNDGTLADVYLLKSLLIVQTAGLRLAGPNPVILVVLDTVDIQGQLLVNGTNGVPGPGGFAGGASPGPGVGQPAFAVATPGSNGGGGSYCGVGGAGGTLTPPGATGGATYGSAAITPLVGGSAGGVAEATTAGGGAVQIVAGQSITIRSFGAINAGGSGTTNVNGSGGGASGGAILLEAPTVTIDGDLGANGGGGMSGFGSGADATADATAAAGGSPYGGAGSAGTTINGAGGTSATGANNTGGGGGGAGRIRINTASGSAAITGIMSPDLTTPCATQGMLH